MHIRIVKNIIPFLICSICVFANLTYAQTQTSVNASDTTLVQMQNRVKLLTAQNDSMQSQLKDLEAKLLEYKIRTESYGSNLSLQTGFYSILVVVLVAIAGFWSYTGVKSEVKRMREDTKSEVKRMQENTNKQLEMQQKKFEEFKNEIHIIQKDIYRVSGHAMQLISLFYYEEKDWLNAFGFSLTAGRDYVYRLNLDNGGKKSEIFPVIKVNLDRALTVFQQIKADPKYRSEFCKKYDTYLSLIRVAMTLTDSEICAVSAKLIVEINEYVDDCKLNI
jgi:hypothetical protein